MDLKTSLASPDEPVETALAVLAAGLASVEDVRDAVADRRTQRPQLDRLLLESEKLTFHQLFQIRLAQATSSKLFAEVAVKGGFLRQSDLDEALHLQSSLCPPLSEVLLARRALTAAQAKAIQHTVLNRLRRPVGTLPDICDA